VFKGLELARIFERARAGEHTGPSAGREHDRQDLELAHRRVDVRRQRLDRPIMIPAPRTMMEGMSAILNDAARRLLDGRNFATVATLGPDGHPHSSVVWIDRDGDTVVFSLTADKQKARNIARDPRVSVSVFDINNPYHSVEIRGTAELVEDPGRSLPERLSQKYLGEPPPSEPADIVRLVARITPARSTSFLLDRVRLLGTESAPAGTLIAAERASANDRICRCACIDPVGSRTGRGRVNPSQPRRSCRWMFRPDRRIPRSRDSQRI